MSGEDVYDMAVWCHICDAALAPCELGDDLDFLCVVCRARISDDAYDYDSIGFCNEHRPDGVQIS